MDNQTVVKDKENDFGFIYRRTLKIYYAFKDIS